MTSAGGKTIVFFPEPGAWGPTNNCVALGDVLRERGHRVVFVVDESFSGVLDSAGLRGARDADGAGRGGRPTRPPIPWAEFIRVTAPEFRRPTIEQQETVTKPIWEALVAGARYSHDRLMEIWDDVRPT